MSSSWEMQDPVVGSFALTDRDFELLRRLIEAEAGIHLTPAKKNLVVGRLTHRLRALGFSSFKEYVRVVTEDAAERARMLDCICTNETQFFREPQQFEFIAQQVIPEWVEQANAGRRPRTIRVWSAGCSTGEEPYSIAMLLAQRFPPQSGWQLEVLATDVSSRALEAAELAVWPIARAAHIPNAHLKAFMLRGVGLQEGKMRAGPRLRSLVRVARLNLHTGKYPDGPRFDLIFCRNVLIYFGQQAKARVLERLMERLEWGGYLFLGHAESLAGTGIQARCVLPTVYTRGGP